MARNRRTPEHEEEIAAMWAAFDAREEEHWGQKRGDTKLQVSLIGASDDAPRFSPEYQAELHRFIEEVCTGGEIQSFGMALYPRVGFIVTNLARSAEGVVAFYNQRGTYEQYIKEGKNAIKWTRLSCRSFAANAVRLQLHALAYNLGNFMRTLAMPRTAEPWSLTSLREKLIKIGAKVVSHGRYVTFHMAEVAVPRQMFQEILSLIAQLRAPPVLV